jgi:hypothetical protein
VPEDACGACWVQVKNHFAESEFRQMSRTLGNIKYYILPFGTTWLNQRRTSLLNCLKGNNTAL